MTVVFLLLSANASFTVVVVKLKHNLHVPDFRFDAAKSTSVSRSSNKERHVQAGAT